jgi:hypothetical protein
MTSARQPPVAGAVEFTDGTTGARSRAAGGPLGHAAVATLLAPPILPASPWRWRLHHDTAELWLERPDGPAGLRYGDRITARDNTACRRPVVTGGTALRQALVALAGLGHTATVARLPDPGRPDLLAVLRVTGRRTTTPAASHAFRTMLIPRPAGTGPVPNHRPPPDGTVRARAVPGLPANVPHRLGEAAGASGGGLLVLDPERLPALAGGTVGVRDREARYAVLFAPTDTAGGWLAAGEALAAVVITAATLATLAVSAVDLLDTPAARPALIPHLPPAASPIALLRVTTTAGPRTPTRPQLQGHGGNAQPRGGGGHPLGGQPRGRVVSGLA